MKPFTLNQAAQISHKSKAAILKAIKNGRLSAKQNELKVWEIDPAELHRVYPYQLENHELPPKKPLVTTELLTELLVKEKQERELDKEERRREREQLQNTIDDLRKRLDEEAQERRKLTKLITHQPESVIRQKKENLLFKKIFKK